MLSRSKMSHAATPPNAPATMLNRRSDVPLPSIGAIALPLVARNGLQAGQQSGPFGKSPREPTGGSLGFYAPRSGVARRA
jgi:hypothetical protein